MDALKAWPGCCCASPPARCWRGWLHLPLPGPVLGLLILLVALRWTAVRAPVGAAADVLLGHLSLLFVPVGVGVIDAPRADRRSTARACWWSIVLSTWIGLAVTALVLRALLPRSRRAGAEGAACRASSSSGSTCRPRRCSG